MKNLIFFLIFITGLNSYCQVDNSDIMINDKGSIELRVDPNFLADGVKNSGLRKFQVIYYQSEGVINSSKTRSLSFKN